MADSAFSYLTQDGRFARLEALHEAVDDLLRQRPGPILTGTDGRTQLRIRGYVHIGLQSVPIYKIVGGAGRYTDFDRWLRSSLADALDEPDMARTPLIANQTPPIDLFKVGELYFVKDGNRRVLAARTRGQVFLPAHVIEYIIDSPSRQVENVKDMLLADEQAHFLRATGLTELRPTQQVACAILGNYQQIRQHIDTHCADLRAAWDQSIHRNVAAASWYDTVYMPIVDLVRRQHVLDFFPEYREGDLYLWSMEHRWNVREHGDAAQLAQRSVGDTLRLHHRHDSAMNDILALTKLVSSGAYSLAPA